MNQDDQDIFPQQFPSDLLARRVPLDPYKDYAWYREDALAVCEALTNAGLGLLGGDVWEISQGGPKHTLDTWYCNPTSEEQVSPDAWARFVVRALDKGREFISRYPESHGKNYAYGLVWTAHKTT